ncbi:MAG: hypothetical protein V4559_10495 [Pseudomonadota bacterium]
MNWNDLEAIAVYLMNLSFQIMIAAEAPRREQIKRGEGLYQAHCQKRHATNGQSIGA